MKSRRRLRSKPSQGLSRSGSFLFATLLIAYFWVLSFSFARFFGDNDPPPFGGEDGDEALISSLFAKSISPIDNKVVYVGMFGLGHRLSKLSAVYHLVHSHRTFQLHSKTTTSRRWPVQRLEVLWEDCESPDGDGAATNVFAYLFGSPHLLVQGNGNRVQCAQETSRFSDRCQGKSLIIRNDVAGYSAGQSYKNAGVALSYRHLPQLWVEKLTMDRIFFRSLLIAFHRKWLVPFLPSQDPPPLNSTGDDDSGLREFLAQHASWILRQSHARSSAADRPFVIGLHVRAGNGERNHFEDSQRGIREQNISSYLSNLVSTVQQFLKATINHEKVKSVRHGRQFPVLFFVATDTLEVLTELQQLLGNQYPVVSLPQHRVPPDGGVSYEAWKEGDTCLDGWRSSMYDMAMLASVDVLIAAKRSTFTQILPLSQIWESSTAAPWRFCEMADAANMMTCFASQEAWLWRRSTDNRGYRNMGHSGIQHFYNPDLEREQSTQQHGVLHKIMIHLPDIAISPLTKNNKPDDHYELQDTFWLNEAHQFFNQSSKEGRMIYGTKISKRYRDTKRFEPNWNWID